MFMVTYSPLIELFAKSCFNCKAENPKVQVKRIGSMATVVQMCNKCLMEDFVWRSQPMVMGRYPSGNILTSFGILMSGINISQAMLMFRHMNLAMTSVQSYHGHQSTFLFPAILKHWEVYQSGLIEDVGGGDPRLGQEMGALIQWVTVLSMVSIPCGAIPHQSWFILNYFRCTK